MSLTMRKDSPPRLEDVATLAGVSAATVSRFLNSPDRVSGAKADRIESAINATGYVPNSIGRALASHQTNIIGALIPTLSNAMFASGLQAFQETLAAENLALILATTNYDRDEEARQVRNLVSQGASSLLLIGKARHPDTIKFLNKRDVPYVLSWCFDRNDDAVYVGFDNFAAAQNAARQVLALGHKKIGLICGHSENNDRAYERKEGYSFEIKSQKAQLTACVETEYGLEKGRIAFQQLYAQAPETTAILCGNDVLAAGAMMAAREQGISVPKDISIVGFDDIGLASILSPGLTTVRVPQLQMGRIAAETLISKRRGKVGVNSIELNTEFVLRGTLASSC